MANLTLFLLTSFLGESRFLFFQPDVPGSNVLFFNFILHYCYF